MSVIFSLSQKSTAVIVLFLLSLSALDHADASVSCVRDSSFKYLSAVTDITVRCGCVCFLVTVS